MFPRRRFPFLIQPLVGTLGSILLCAASVNAADKPAKGIAAASKPSPGISIPYRTERAGVVSINVYRQDGMLVRRLVRAERLPVGPHSVSWDGLAEDGTPVPAGDYTWRGIIHDGVGLKLRGWAGNSGSTPWPTADGKGDWGGDAGVPSAVAADAQKVYLGWSLARQGKAILACDLEGRIQWAHRRAEGPSGCQALCVDNGVLYVLGGLEGVGAEGGCIYRLNAKDGKPLPWPNGQLDLKLAAFWPAEASAKPDTADAMAVRHDRIYLSFTKSEFMTVLDAKSGAYLQTVVGLPPGKLDIAPTKTNLPDDPDKIVDADFALIEVGNGLLGKVLFAHDPLWVVTSVAVPMNSPLPIAALTIVGDTGKFHRHDAFIGLGAPYHLIQIRPLLDTEDLTWAAGKPGGRPLSGPWQPNTLRNIRALALAADGRLWVAEGDEFPKRFSVWDTTGQEGKMVKEFFGPMGANDGGGAINPLDPGLFFAEGCEWRVDRETGAVRCLGVISRESIEGARYGVGENGVAYLVVKQTKGWVQIFERVGVGDYRLRTQIHPAGPDGAPAPRESAAQTSIWADDNNDGAFQPNERRLFPELLDFKVEATLQDLSLTAAHASGAMHFFAVESWSPCGSPRFNLSAGKVIAGSGRASADGKLSLAVTTGENAEVVCSSLESGQPVWKLPRDAVRNAGTSIGVAKLPAPLGNVWLMKREGAPWLLLNEHGYEVAQLFAPDEKSVAWPKSAKPGADMTRALPGGYGALAQAVDGKLYLQSGESAAWNLEVTGLDTAKALPGGAITVLVPPAK